MGLFNINIPLLYGEGENAFIRLQEEIMKNSEDQSLFAWKSMGGSEPYRGLLATSPAEYRDSSEIFVERTTLTAMLLAEDAREERSHDSGNRGRWFYRTDIAHQSTSRGILVGLQAQEDRAGHFCVAVLACEQRITSPEGLTHSNGVAIILRMVDGKYSRVYPRCLLSLFPNRGLPLHTRHRVSACDPLESTQLCVRKSALTVSSWWDPELSLVIVDTDFGKIVHPRFFYTVEAITPEQNTRSFVFVAKLGDTAIGAILLHKDVWDLNFGKCKYVALFIGMDRTSPWCHLRAHRRKKNLGKMYGPKYQLQTSPVNELELKPGVILVASIREETRGFVESSNGTQAAIQVGDRVDSMEPQGTPPAENSIVIAKPRIYNIIVRIKAHK